MISNMSRSNYEFMFYQGTKEEWKQDVELKRKIVRDAHREWATPRTTDEAGNELHSNHQARKYQEFGGGYHGFRARVSANPFNVNPNQRWEDILTEAEFLEIWSYFQS